MSEWISVEDEYPPDITPVLGFHPLRLYQYAVCFRQEREDGNIWSWSGIAAHENLKDHCIIPTHWMPLPSPPNWSKTATNYVNLHLKK